MCLDKIVNTYVSWNIQKCVKILLDDIGLVVRIKVHSFVPGSAENLQRKLKDYSARYVYMKYEVNLFARTPRLRG